MHEPRTALSERSTFPALEALCPALHTIYLFEREQESIISAQDGSFCPEKKSQPYYNGRKHFYRTTHK